MDGAELVAFAEGVVSHIDEQHGRGAAWAAALLLSIVLIGVVVGMFVWLS